MSINSFHGALRLRSEVGILVVMAKNSSPLRLEAVTIISPPDALERLRKTYDFLRNKASKAEVLPSVRYARPGKRFFSPPTYITCDHLACTYPLAA